MGKGIKYDQGKPRLAEMFLDFANPLTEVAKVWAFGAEKYGKSNWKEVENAEDRYTNAMLRHLIAEQYAENDEESGLKHAAHVAWNALARLYFKLLGTTTKPKDAVQLKLDFGVWVEGDE